MINRHNFKDFIVNAATKFVLYFLIFYPICICIGICYIKCNNDKMHRTEKPKTNIIINNSNLRHSINTKEPRILYY